MKVYPDYNRHDLHLHLISRRRSSRSNKLTESLKRHETCTTTCTAANKLCIGNSFKLNFGRFGVDIVSSCNWSPFHQFPNICCWLCEDAEHSTINLVVPNHVHDNEMLKFWVMWEIVCEFCRLTGFGNSVYYFYSYSSAKKYVKSSTCDESIVN